jgi:hypothetical protein
MRYSKGGQAQAAKLNQDESVNGSSQPAVRGSVIQRQHHVQPQLLKQLCVKAMPTVRRGASTQAPSSSHSGYKVPS